MIFSEKIFEAVNFAAKKHDGQFRLSSAVPYIVHPFRVGMALMKIGCDENVIIAGILHDVAEDTDATLEDISKMFGDAVALYVGALTDPDAPYAERKRLQIEKYSHASSEIKAIKAADLLDNIRSTVLGMREGEDVLKSLSHTKEEYIRNQHLLLNALQEGWQSPLCDDIAMYLDELEKRCAEK